MSTAAVYNGSFCHHALTTELDHVQNTFGRSNCYKHQANLLSLIDKISSLDNLLSKLASEATERAVNLSSRDLSQYNYASDKPMSNYLERSWEWILESTQLAELHVKNAAIYQQFYQKLDELKFYMRSSQCQQFIQINDPISVCDIPCWADPVISHLQLMLNSYGAHSDQMIRLVKSSRALIPVYLRTNTLKATKPGIWLCRYESPSENVKLEPNDKITILDTSDPHVWKIQTRYKQVLHVPAICCLITGPDYQAMDKASLLAEELIYHWRSVLNKTWPNFFKSINMVIEDILCENVEIDHFLHERLISLLSEFDSVMIQFMRSSLHDNPDIEHHRLAVTETWLQNLELCFTILENDRVNRYSSSHSKQHQSPHHRHRNWGQKSMSHINTETIDLLRQLIILYKEHFEAFSQLKEVLNSDHTLICDYDTDQTRLNKTDFEKIVDCTSSTTDRHEQTPRWPLISRANDAYWLSGRKKFNPKISKYYCQVQNYRNYHQSAISILPQQEDKRSVRRTRHLIQVNDSKTRLHSSVRRIEVSKIKMRSVVDDSGKYEVKLPLKRSSSSSSLSSDNVSSKPEKSSIFTESDSECDKINERTIVEPKTGTDIITKSKSICCTDSSSQTGLTVGDPDQVLVIEDSSTGGSRHYSRCDCSVQTIHFSSKLVTDSSHYVIPKCSRKIQTFFYQDSKLKKKEKDESSPFLVVEETQTDVSIPPIYIDHEESRIHSKDKDTLQKRKDPLDHSTDSDDNQDSCSDVSDIDRRNEIKNKLKDKKTKTTASQTAEDFKSTVQVDQLTQTSTTFPPIHIDREESKIPEKDKDKVKKKKLSDDSEDSCELCSDLDSDSDINEIDHESSKRSHTRDTIFRKKLITVACQTTEIDQKDYEHDDDSTQTNITLPPIYTDRETSKITEGDRDRKRYISSDDESSSEFTDSDTDNRNRTKHLTVGIQTDVDQTLDGSDDAECQTLCSLPIDWIETDEIIVDQVIISKSKFVFGRDKGSQTRRTKFLVETSSKYETKDGSFIETDTTACQTETINLKLVAFGYSQSVQVGSGFLFEPCDVTTQTVTDIEEGSVERGGDHDRKEDRESVTSSSDESIPVQEDVIKRKDRSHSNTSVKVPDYENDYKKLRPGKVYTHVDDQGSQTILTVPATSSKPLVLELDKDDSFTQTTKKYEENRASQTEIRQFLAKETQARIFMSDKGNMAATLVLPEDDVSSQTIEVTSTNEEIQATPNLVNNSMNVTLIGGASESKALQCRPIMISEEIDAEPELNDKELQVAIIGAPGETRGIQCFVEMVNEAIDVRPIYEDVYLQVTPPPWSYADTATQCVWDVKSISTLTERKIIIDDFSARELKFKNKKAEIRPVTDDSNVGTPHVLFKSCGYQTDSTSQSDFSGMVRSGDLNWGIDQAVQMETNLKILAHMQINVQKSKIDSIQILEIDDEQAMS